MRAPTLDSLVVDPSAAVSLQQQLCGEVKRLIHQGRWRGGSRVPSSRALAEDLGLSRNTVTAAYDRLIGEGYLEARPRSGLVVSTLLVRRALTSPRRVVAHAAPFGPAVESPKQTPRPFRPCQPDVRLFPLRLWNRLRARQLRTHGTGLLMYQSEFTLGLPALRQALAAYLRESRGVQCDWRQVVVTTGSQQALYLLAQVLLNRDGVGLVEDPGYLGARRAWASRDARVEPIVVDEQGGIPPSAAGRLTPSLVYLTPSRQFPTGACLPVARRLAWLAYARRTGAWIVEDDYDSEYRYGRPPMPSLHSLDTSGRVIYVGSMSKVLCPSLRMGYAVVPPALLDRLAALRSVVDDHGPLIDQATLAAFIETGAFFTHIRRSRRHYAERLRGFLDGARQAGLPLQFAHTDGGMNLVGRLPVGWDDVRVSASLADDGFDVPSLAGYSLRRQTPGVVLGFAAFTVAESRRHLENLARAFERLGRKARGGGGRHK